MIEYPISISMLNDFVFCPASIYFHLIDDTSNTLACQSTKQMDGANIHGSIDNQKYSTSAKIMQGSSVYSSKYNLFGKIDLFDVDKGEIRERKKKIKSIFDGQVFQLYAQYFALTEMGYTVRRIVLYSYDDNKTYEIPLPQKDHVMLQKFQETIRKLNEFELERVKQNNIEKCKNCIYEPLCQFSQMKED